MRNPKTFAAAVVPALLIAGGAIAVFGPAGAQIATPPASAPPAQNEAPMAVATAPRPGAPMSFADLTARLAPAVVNVSTTQKVEIGKGRVLGPGGGGDGAGNPFEEFFKRFQQQQQGDDGQPVTREATSLGSGFIVDPAGYIVTNNHVISGGDPRGGDAKVSVDTITVTLADRREFKARVVGRDQVSDLALLKIEATNLPYVKFGNSKGARVGDWVIAIGNPFGLGGTVTAGIVSALHRNIGSQYDRYIQTDASINQGNSGGPLFDLDGNVIGINTAIYSPTGGNVGLGFAIPAEAAGPVIDQLKRGSAVKRGYLGVSIQPLTADIAAGLNLPKDRGEIVAQVVPGEAADRAGIKQGDVVVKVAGEEVTFDNTLSFIVANQAIGTTVPVEVIRGTKRLTLNVKIGLRPAESVIQGATPNDDDSDTPAVPQSDATRSSLGISLTPLTPALREQLKIPSTVQGVAIAGINQNSDAAQEGLQRGDVILQINQMPTPNPAAAAAAVDAARKAGRDTVLMLVQRGAIPARFIGIKLQPPGAAK